MLEERSCRGSASAIIFQKDLEAADATDHEGRGSWLLMSVLVDAMLLDSWRSRWRSDSSTLISSWLRNACAMAASCAQIDVVRRSEL